MNYTLPVAVAQFTLAIACPLHAGLSAPLSPQEDPTTLWSLDYASGVIWQMGHNTPLAYTIAPQIISLRTPAHIRLNLGDGELTVRARGSLLIEPVLKGPESLYLGLSLSPSIEYWFNKSTHRTAFYFSVGGGAGLIDSQGVEGGQGQDLTLNWFAESGLRYYITPRTSVFAGCLFQHWSNGGMTDPNPGVDALGAVAGLSLAF